MIWKIRQIDNQYLKLVIEDDSLLFMFGTEKLDLKFETSNLTQEIRREIVELLGGDKNTFLKYTDELLKVKKDNFICIKLINGKYILVKVVDAPFLLKEGIKIHILKSRELNDVEIPVSLKMDNRTKSTKLSFFKTKEIETFFIILNRVLNSDEKVYEEYTQYFLDSSRQATDSAKGYIGQCLVGMIYFFYKENHKRIKSIKIEGALEDIEIEYRDSTTDYIQVKIAENPYAEKKFNKKRFEEGINGIKLTYEKTEKYGIKTNRLIYASNTFYQPIERLTNIIKNGNDNEVFFESMDKEFLLEEKKKMMSEFNLSKELNKKLHIMRVNPKYLSETNEFIAEYNQLNKNLDTSDDKINILKDLRQKFINNSTVREEKISVHDVAFSFLRKSRGDKTFNNAYGDDLDELFGEDDIGEIIKTECVRETILEATRRFYIIDEYFESKKEFEKDNKELKKELKNTNIKQFLDKYYIILDKYDIFSKHFNDVEKKYIFYKYILFKIFASKSTLNDIITNFGLEDV